MNLSHAEEVLASRHSILAVKLAIKVRGIPCKIFRKSDRISESDVTYGVHAGDELSPYGELEETESTPIILLNAKVDMPDSFENGVIFFSHSSWRSGGDDSDDSFLIDPEYAYSESINGLNVGDIIEVIRSDIGLIRFKVVKPEILGVQSKILSRVILSNVAS